jgi:hypothetical protein
MHRVVRDSERPPARGSIVPMIVIFGLIALAAVGMALIVDDPVLSVFFGAIALVVTIIPVSAIVVGRRATPGTVRIDRDAAALRFVPPPTAAVLFFVAATAIALVGVLSLAGGVTTTSRVASIAGAAGLLWLLQQLWGLRLPVGLTLSESGLRGVRGSKPVNLRWDELDQAMEAKGQLMLHPRSGPSIFIGSQYVASDPHVLVPVINFFVEHPEHRAVLATPMAALALVEQTATTR